MIEIGGTKIWENDEQNKKKKTSKDHSLFYFIFICIIIVITCTIFNALEIIREEFSKLIYLGICLFVSIIAGIIIVLVINRNKIFNFEKVELIIYIIFGLIVLFFIYDIIFDIEILSKFISVDANKFVLLDALAIFIAILCASILGIIIRIFMGK